MAQTGVTRRQVLSVLGVSSTAGCLSSTPFSEGEGIQLGTLIVGNGFEDPRSVQLQLYREGEVVYEGTVELEGNSSEYIDPSWSTDPAEYTLLYATENDLGKVSFSQDSTGAESDKCNHPSILFGDLYNDGLEVGIWPQDNPEWGTC